MNRDEFELVKAFLEWENIRYYVEDDPEIIVRKSSGKQNPKIPGIWVAYEVGMNWCEGIYWCIDFVRSKGLNRV